MSKIVVDAFFDQARWCDQLGSPFTAKICRLCAERLQPTTLVARSILEWPGDPSAKADSVPLRVAGALHYLARSPAGAKLRAQYPPNVSNDESLWSAIDAALGDQESVVLGHLAYPPQTNEVMRSAALLPGMLEIAKQTGLPLDLYELGASAGLNLILDRYRYKFGEAQWGDQASSLQIEPEWHGAEPSVDTRLIIRSRRGVDLNPIDLNQEDVQRRLISYVWADQVERLQRLSAAISIWLRDPPLIEQSDAAAWLGQSGIARPIKGVARVLFHSITWSYLPIAAQQRIRQLMSAIGEQASRDAPLAWLHYELSEQGAALQLQMWPDGKVVTLATGHPHGAVICWLQK